LLTGLQLLWENNVSTGTPIPDQSGNGFSATDCNPSRLAVSVGGQLGIDFDAQWSFLKSIRLYALDDAKLRGGSGQSFTVSVWVYPHNSIDRNSGAPCLCKWGSTNEYWLGFNDASGNINFTVRKLDNSGNVTLALGAITEDSWFHLVGGYDDANGVIFGQINGGTRVTQASTGARAGTENFSVGNYSGTPCGNSLPVDGFFGQAGFWQRALSASEAVTLFNSGTMLRYPFS